MSVGVIKISGAVKVLRCPATKKGAHHLLEPRLRLPFLGLSKLQQLKYQGV